MTTHIQVINYGPLPVKVEVTSEDNRVVHKTEIVEAGHTSEGEFYVYPGSRVVITEGSK